MTTVADLVETQVARTPGAVAVVSEHATLTYSELDGRANRLAARLQDLGVGPDTIVGVCFDRSVELAVALLGVLKAGGACLPLDPALPPARLGFMVGDACPVALIAPPTLAATLPAGARVVPLDDLTGAPAPPRTIGPDQLAYVIYTSGSTGVPKGVLLTHGALVNHHRAAIELYGLSGHDRVLQFCSLGFDASIEELFPTWASGGAVVFRPDDVPSFGRSWLSWLRHRGITVMNLPTGYWQEWTLDLERLGEPLPPALRLVVVGGEKAHGSALRRWAQAGGGRARWVNAYGPTEATCMATAWEAPAGGPVAGDPPIGRPLPNVSTRIVDEDGVEVAPGGRGELLIGGAGLARGYLRRDELTSERFVVDGDGTRWYRTGDIVRELPGAELDFVGRLDGQVKVQGVRVELHEVEAMLARHPAVSETAVVVREGPGGPQLVAYVTVGTGAGALASELIDFVAGLLPAAMVPSAMVFVDAFPRTPNGKIDRDALPLPPRATVRGGAAPRSSTEQRLAGIWASVLGIEAGAISVDDDFFDLGGQSLLAMQVIARVREEFGTETTVQAAIEASTIAALAAVVDSDSAGGGPRTRPVVRRREGGDEATLPLSLAEEQMWDLEMAADPPGLYNVTALQRLPSPVDEDALRRALAFLVARHEALRTTFGLDGGRPCRTVHGAAALDLAVTHLTGARDELQSRLAVEDARPLLLDRQPLCRAHLFHLDGDSQLAVTFDHLVCDGTAAYVFLDELALAYDAFRAGGAPALPPLDVQPADFAVWQRRHVTDGVLGSQLAWWAGALAGAPLGPAVRFDHVPLTPTRRVSFRALVLDASRRRRLDDLARATGSTVFGVTAAAVGALLGRWSGADDVMMSTTLSGRGRPELDALMGMFSGIGRIRTDLGGDPTFLEVVLRTRRLLFGMYEHQDVPFMRVRREVLPHFPTGGPELFAALPTDLQYFRTRRSRWGSQPDRGLYFRGQLHPLGITLLDDGTELSATFSFKDDFYEPATIDRLAAALEAVVRAIARDPSLRVSALPV